METRANYIAVGFFTLAALLAVFVLLYWVNNFGEDKNLVPMEIRIHGSVSGLGPGSTVQFNGINVGRVDELKLDPNDPRYVVVKALVLATTPIRRDTKATIGIRGLSGGAFVQLEGGTPQSLAILQQTEQGQAAPQIEGDPAALSDLLARVNGIAVRVERVMLTLENFVSSNNESASRTLANVETFSNALAENSDGVAKFLESAGNIAESLGGLSKKLDGSITRAEEILAAVDPQAVGNTVKNAEEFSRSLADQREEFKKLVANVNKTATELSGFSENLNKTLAKVDGIVEAVKPGQVSEAVKNFNETAERASKLLGSIDPAKVKTTIDDIGSAAAGTSKIVSAIDQESLSNLIADASAASKKLAELVESIPSDQLSNAVANINSSAEKASKLMESIDPTKVESTVDNIESAAASARSLMAGIDQQALSTLISDASAASKNISSLVAAIDAAKVNDAVENFSAAAKGAQTIVSDVSKVTKPIGEKADDIAKIIDDASQLAARLNESSKKVDGVISRLDNLLGSGAGDGLVADARRTLAEFRRASRSLDAQIAQVAAGINRFTKRGLADTQGLIQDARQSLNGIDRVMRNLQRNPSSLITGSGGSRVRETTTQRPRR